MLLLIGLVTTSCWLLVGKGIALPTQITDATSTVHSDPTDGDIGSRLAESFSSLTNDSLITVSISSTNSTTVGSERSSINGFDSRKTRTDDTSATNLNISTITPKSSATSSYSSSSTVDSAHMISSSTTSGYNFTTSPTGPTPLPFAPVYALSFAELLSAITAEFVFNVAGDHVLFPMIEDHNEDHRLHTTAIIVAELLQKLHITPEVYRILNTTAYNVAEDTWKGRKRGANPVAKVLLQTVDAAVQDPMLRDEYLAVKQRVANQIYSLPLQHGKFASSRSQTLYDVTPEQLAYAEKLMEDARVKKLIMSVTFFKASQFEEVSVPVWVRSQTNLAKAVFELAKQPKWRDELQRMFDEALTENMEKYDAMGGDDESIFQKLREKFEKNASLNAELKMRSSQY